MPLQIAGFFTFRHALPFLHIGVHLRKHFEIQPLSRRIPAPSVAAVCDCRLHVDTPNQSAQFCNSVALLRMNRQTKSGLPEFNGIKSKSAASWLVEV